MTKKEFVKKYAEKIAQKHDDARELINAFLDTVKKAVAKGETVQFVGWGTWEVKLNESKKRTKSKNRQRN